MIFSLLIIIGLVLIIYLILIVENKITDTFTDENKYKINILKERKKVFKYRINKVPILKVRIDDKYFGMILDTGSNINVLNTQYITIPDDVVDSVESLAVIGIDSASKLQAKGTFTFHLADYEQEFCDEFYSKDLSSIEESLEDPLPIIGLLGSKFFKDNHWTIDYHKNIIWIS